MTTHNITPQLTRIDRAEQLGRQLHDSMRAWMASDPVAGDAEIADDRLSWSLVLRVREEAPLDEWRHLFGEAVHHLRASLDNLAMCLAKSAGVPEGNLKHVAFPVSATRQAWRSDRSKIRHLPAEYRMAIEAIQPFQRGTQDAANGDLLIVLRDLDNQDKHYIQVSGVVEPNQIHHQALVRFESEGGARASTPPDTEIFAAPFVDGEMLMRWRTKGRIAEVEGGIGIAGQVLVILPDGRQEGVAQLLASLCTYTRKVVEYVAATQSTPSA